LYHLDLRHKMHIFLVQAYVKVCWLLLPTS
jgi:hypothetical protein